MPSSITSIIKYSTSSSLTLIEILPFSLVNLIAFPIRLVVTCLILSLSLIINSGKSFPYYNSNFISFFLAYIKNILIDSCRVFFKLNLHNFILNFPDFNCAKSRRSFERLSNYLQLSIDDYINVLSSNSTWSLTASNILIIQFNGTLNS